MFVGNYKYKNLSGDITIDLNFTVKGKAPVDDSNELFQRIIGVLSNSGIPATAITVSSFEEKRPQ